MSEIVKPPTQEEIEFIISESEKRKSAFKNECIKMINEYMRNIYFDATHRSRTPEIDEGVWLKYHLYPAHVSQVYNELVKALESAGWKVIASMSPHRMYFTLSPKWL